MAGRVNRSITSPKAETPSDQAVQHPQRTLFNKIQFKNAEALRADYIVLDLESANTLTNPLSVYGPAYDMMVEVSDSPRALEASPQIPAESDPFLAQGTPSLEEQARLSVPQKIGDMAYRIFWGAVTLPGRSLSAIANYSLKSMVERDAVKNGMEITFEVSELDTPLKKLNEYLSELHKKVSTEDQIYELKQEVIVVLKDFLYHQKEYLKESIDSAGFREGLNYQQQNEFRVLLHALETDQPLQATFIKPLYEFINTCWLYQLNFHCTKAAKEIFFNL